MEDFDKGAKRKCTSCSTLFFDFGKFPIICPNCGATVNSLLTNVSKRGRPPKVVKEEASVPETEDKSSDIVNDEGLNPDVDVDVGIETDDEDSVDEMVEINRDEDQ
jgi:hypothetical protein|tara:strand:- start:525 stop:842 length:318 start_codon:yes stop_codon:yes gene_type:complete